MNILSIITGGLLVGLGLKYLGRGIINYMSIAYILSGAYYFLLRDRYYKMKRQESKNGKIFYNNRGKKRGSR